MSDIDFFTPGARLALELECLLMDTRDAAAQSRWWGSAHEALEQWRQAVRAMEVADAAQQTADDEVVFIDGVGAGRSSVKSCRDGVQWIRVGNRVYWPLSDADAQRLQSACCGNGSFDGHSTVVQPEASTTLEQADDHARICFKLAEQYKSDPVLFAALTDAAAIIRDLMRELRLRRVWVNAPVWRWR